MLHPYHSRVLSGAEAYCALQGYKLLFISLRYPLNAGRRELHLPQLTGGRRVVCGYIIGGTNSPGLLDLLNRKDVPFAVLGNNVVGDWRYQDYDVVWDDDVQATYDAIRYLQVLGHQAIWFVGNCLLPWFSRCYAGYSRAMLEASLAPRLEDVSLENMEEVGYLATKSILCRDDSASAIFAGSTIAAYGTYRALKEAGLRIPEDISVAAVGECEPTMLDPPLTTVREFPEQVGRNLARLLLNRIGNRDLGPQQAVIPTQLVKRESCGRPSGTRPSRPETGVQLHESSTGTRANGGVRD
jgi:DNA-binding LacI/PurR family transcriptional regulator